MKNLLTALILVLCITGAAEAQIGLGITTPHPNAYFQINSTTKGVLLPRMTAVQRQAIAPTATANGLIVYDTDSSAYMFWTGTAWKKIGADDGRSWSLTGNAGTSPSTNLLGTSDAADLAIGSNNIPRMYVTNESEVGIGFANPSYALDITTGTAGIDNCSYNGIRVKNLSGGISNPCESGLLMGYSSSPLATDDEAVIRNFGLKGSGIKTMALGVGPSLTMLRLSGDGLTGIASGNMLPKYSLDINNEIAGVSPCGRNGIRLNTLRTVDNPCDNGLFMGYNNTANINSVSFWNFSTDNASNNRYIRLGFGADFSESPVGESMRILPPGKGVGINQLNPQAMLHISNYTGAGALPGVMVTSPSVATGEKGFFTGLDATGQVGPNDGLVWNYQNAALVIGTNNLERMRITKDGNIGIGTITPNAPLQFSNNLDNRKLVLYEGNNDDNQYFGFGVNSSVLRYQVNSTFSDHVFFAGVNSSSSVELMRIKGNGNVGIGNANPAFILDVNNRMRIRSGGNVASSAGLWLNNSDNTALQTFIGNETDNTVGFYGSGSGWSFTVNTSSGKVKIADGTQANGKILSCDAAGVASWVNSAATKSAVKGVFAGAGANLTVAAGQYINTYIDLPPGRYLVIATYLLSHGGSGGALQAGQAQWVRTSFSESAFNGTPTADIIGSGIISGSLAYPSSYGLVNGQVVIDNTSGGTKRYYVWASMANTGGQPVGYALDGIGSNFWGENNLTAVPMN